MAVFGTELFIYGYVLFAEPENLAIFTSNGTSRQSEWDNVLHQQALGLDREAAIHTDVVFVPMTDTYRNIPLKLLKFYEW